MFKALCMKNHLLLRNYQLLISIARMYSTSWRSLLLIRIFYHIMCSVKFHGFRTIITWLSGRMESSNILKYVPICVELFETPKSCIYSGDNWKIYHRFGSVGLSASRRSSKNQSFQTFWLAVTTHIYHLVPTVNVDPISIINDYAMKNNVSHFFIFFWRCDSEFLFYFNRFILIYIRLDFSKIRLWARYFFRSRHIISLHSVVKYNAIWVPLLLFE